MNIYRIIKKNPFVLRGFLRIIIQKMNYVRPVKFSLFQKCVKIYLVSSGEEIIAEEIYDCIRDSKY